jgi:DNA-binding MarR family transcriptional regulator
MAMRFLSPVHRAIRQISLYFEERSEHFGLTPSEGHMLTYLRSYSPTAVGELHRVFGIKRSTLTSMLDRLEKRRLITRRLSREDRRVFLVDLTRRGRITADGVRVAAQDLEKGILERLGEGDLAGFDAVMDAIAAATGVAVRSQEKKKEMES